MIMLPSARPTSLAYKLAGQAVANAFDLRQNIYLKPLCNADYVRLEEVAGGKRIHEDIAGGMRRLEDIAGGMRRLEEARGFMRKLREV